MCRLEGKVAIVTGGASGIGASAVALFQEHGAKVVIADIQDDLGHALALKLGGHVIYTRCDVTKEDQVANLVDTTVAKFGQLDIMYSNAGIMNDDFFSILKAEKSTVERFLNVNLVGAVLVAKHAARVMVANNKGSIIFTGSACTEISIVHNYSYIASKHGLLGLCKTLAVELGAHGVRVNSVSPFGVLTGTNVHDDSRVAMFGQLMGAVGNLKGKVLTPEDIAKAALYLASDDAAYVSGLNLVVDGGYRLVNPTLATATGGLF